MDLLSPELSWARTHLADLRSSYGPGAPHVQGWSENAWEGAGEGKGAFLVPGFDLQRHSQISYKVTAQL